MVVHGKMTAINKTEANMTVPPIMIKDGVIFIGFL